MESRIWIIAFLGMAGCSKAPVTPAVYQKPEQQQTTPSSSPDLEAENPEPASSPPALANSFPPAIAFSNPATNSAWNQYVDSFESVRSVPPPPQLSDPSAIGAHIEEINRRLAILQQARAALMNSLTSPEDQKRFKAAEQSLNAESSQ